MFSLIITIVSIALVALLAIATIYYGGTVYSNYTASAEASTLTNQASQLYAGALLYRNATNTWPASPAVLLNALPDGSVPLNSLPVPPKGTLAYSTISHALAQEYKEWEFVMDSNQVLTFIALREAIKPETCLQVKLKAEGNDSLLATTYEQSVAQIKENIQERITAGSIKPENYGFQKVGDNDWVLNEAEKARLASLAVIPNKIDPGLVYQCVDEVFVNSEALANPAFTYFWKAPSGGDSCNAVTGYNTAYAKALGCGASSPSAPNCPSGVFNSEGVCIPPAYAPPPSSGSLQVLPSIMNFGLISPNSTQYALLTLVNDSDKPIALDVDTGYGLDLNFTVGSEGVAPPPEAFSVDSVAFGNCTQGAYGPGASVWWVFIEPGAFCFLDVSFTVGVFNQAYYKKGINEDIQLKLKAYTLPEQMTSFETANQEDALQEIHEVEIGFNLDVPETDRPRPTSTGTLLFDETCYHNGFASSLECSSLPLDQFSLVWDLYDNSFLRNMTFTSTTSNLSTGTNLILSMSDGFGGQVSPNSGSPRYDPVAFPVSCSGSSCTTVGQSGSGSGVCSGRTLRYCLAAMVQWYYAGINNEGDYEINITLRDSANQDIAHYGGQAIAFNPYADEMAGEMPKQVIPYGQPHPFTVSLQGNSAGNWAYALRPAPPYQIAINTDSTFYLNDFFNSLPLPLLPATATKHTEGTLDYYNLEFTVGGATLDYLHKVHYANVGIYHPATGRRGRVSPNQLISSTIQSINGAPSWVLAPGGNPSCLGSDSGYIKNGILRVSYGDGAGGNADVTQIGGIYLYNGETGERVPVAYSIIAYPSGSFGTLDIQIPVLSPGDWGVNILNKYGKGWVEALAEGRHVSADYGATLRVLPADEVANLVNANCPGSTNEEDAASSAMQGCTPSSGGMLAIADGGDEYSSRVVVDSLGNRFRCSNQATAPETPPSTTTAEFTFTQLDNCIYSATGTGCGYGGFTGTMCRFLSQNVSGRFTGTSGTASAIPGLASDLAQLEGYGRYGVGGAPGGPAGLCSQLTEVNKTSCRATGVSGLTGSFPAVTISCSYNMNPVQGSWGAWQDIGPSMPSLTTCPTNGTCLSATCGQVGMYTAGHPSYANYCIKYKQ